MLRTSVVRVDVDVAPSNEFLESAETYVTDACGMCTESSVLDMGTESDAKQFQRHDLPILSGCEALHDFIAWLPITEKRFAVNYQDGCHTRGRATGIAQEVP